LAIFSVPVTFFHFKLLFPEMIKWLIQCRLLRSIAKYAMKEFKKWKKYDENLSEQHIAHEIFKSR
jgi:hypothetical protein